MMIKPMKASKILNNLIALNEQSELSYEHPIKVKIGTQMFDLEEKVAIEFIDNEPCYVFYGLSGGSQ